jgi:hypothetical protein
MNETGGDDGARLSPRRRCGPTEGGLALTTRAEMADGEDGGDWPSAVVESAGDRVEKWCQEHLGGRG